jgi:citrate synthase
LADAERPDAGKREWLDTWIGSSTPDRITVGGRDLASEVMGHLTLTELAYLLVTRRTPTAGERRLVDAVLVSLADHGLTPSALAARLTYTGAPEAVQGAVAAGLLGAGSVFLGPAGDTAFFLAEALDGQNASVDDASLRRIAEAAVEGCRRAGRRVPGLGTRCIARRTPACRACTSWRPKKVCSDRTWACSNRWRRCTRS